MTHPIREYHFACLLTGEQGHPFPKVRWPRLTADYPPLFVLAPFREGTGNVMRLYGGEREPSDLTAVAGLRRAMRAQTGDDATHQVMGPIGSALHWSNGIVSTYTQSWLSFHTGEDPIRTPSNSRYARVSAQTAGDFNWACEPPHLTAPEQIIRLGLALCDVPVYHQPLTPITGQAMEYPIALKALFVRMLPYQPSDAIHVLDDWLILRRPDTLTIWLLPNAQQRFRRSS